MVKENGIIKALSTEEKPTEIDPSLTSMPVKEGDILLEWDTGDKYAFLGGEWVIQG